MGRKGKVIVRDRKQPVSGSARVMPTPAAAEVQAGIPYVFNVSHFAAAWRLGGYPTPLWRSDPRSHQSRLL